MDQHPAGEGGSNGRDHDGPTGGGPPPLVQSWMKATQNTLHNLTVKRYCLPDKTVASQVLMYRQLLHTACRPNLRLSRDYTGTAAQVAVRHQPWWSSSVENGLVLTMVETGKMVISYDNLITRLWNTGVLRFEPSSVDTTELPPIPDDRWIYTLGFQQADPVTDFRSGGVLSLALLVWIVESCPDTFHRFCDGGDAAVLPFGITSINITDLLAKLFLLSKKNDRMEALLSQKPFWQMFNDPSAILVCQQVALDILADVVVELSSNNRTISVFDFAQILKLTEHRVEYDLLGAGPVSVADLRRIYQSVRRKYLEKNANVAVTTTMATAAETAQATTTTKTPASTATAMKQNPGLLLRGLASKVGATSIIDKAGQATGSVLSKGNELLAKVVMIHSPAAAAAATTNNAEHHGDSSVANSALPPPPSSSSSFFDFANKNKKKAAVPPPAPPTTASAAAVVASSYNDNNNDDNHDAPQTEEIDFFAVDLLGGDSSSAAANPPLPGGGMEEVDFFAGLGGDDDWVGAATATTTTSTILPPTGPNNSTISSSSDHEATTANFQIDDDDFML
jgi:ELMO/CED-12 family